MSKDTGSPKQLPDLEHPQFFVSQCEHISTLLDEVVKESSTATDPDACMDYLELTEILTELLDESQYYSMLSIHQIQDRRREVESFAGKIQTIQDAVADWDKRTQADVTGGAMTADVMTAGSRKRARSFDSDEPLMEVSKRRRESEAKLEQDIGMNVGMAVSMDIGMDIGLEYTSSTIERAPAAWWAEPFYD